MLTRTICHLWGPLYIYSYGAFIALGCIIIYYIMLKDPKRMHLISEEKLINLFSAGILVGIIGGRTLHILSNYNHMNSFFDLCALHEGGLSILGTIIALLIFIPWYCKRTDIAILPLLDFAALYAPLLHSISRLGCFFAGCCYGKASNLAWAVHYTDADTIAPLNCWLHPTQLYSSLMLLGIFLFLYFIAQRYTTRSGQLMCFYIALAGLERFVVDFLRDDQEFLTVTGTFFSMHQWIALGLIAGAGILYFVLYNKR